MIGQLILGKFKILDEVGAGAFATVYLGRNLETNEIVAVKVLSQQLTRDRRYVERFQREAMLAQRLKHPNIVRVLDHGIEDGRHFLVMEFVEGVTLDKVIRQKGTLSVAETHAYGEQICAALDAAFKVRIVHRDIKPANLMVTPGGRVKVMDFGIARTESMSDLTQTGTFLGTPRYISPEAAQGSPADVRSDLYSLGLVMYEMLIGAPAFDAGNSMAVLRMQVERELPPIRSIRPDVPSWLEAVILRAAAKAPSERYQTPAEMLAALRKQSPVTSGLSGTQPAPWLGETVKAPIASAPAAPKPRLSKVLVGSLIAVVLLLTVGLIVLFLFAQEEKRNAIALTSTGIALTNASSMDTLSTSTPRVVIVTATPGAVTATDLPTHTPVPTVFEPSPTRSLLAAGATSLPPTEVLLPTVTPAPSAEPTDVPAPTMPATRVPTSTQLPTTTMAPTATYTKVPAITVPPTQAPTSSAEPTETPVPAAIPVVEGRITFSSGGVLHIVDAATGQDSVAPIAGMRQPDFRADGQQVIADGQGAGRDSLWTIIANTGAFGREQSPFTNDFHPSWSPDGSRFAYDSLHHGLGNFEMLYTQSLAGPGSQPEVTLAHNGQQIRGSSPVWMHDDWIAFTGCDYWPGATGGSRCGIYRMPSWGGQPLPILSGATSMRATDNYAGHLLYMSPEGGDWEVYIIPNQGGEPRNLSQSPGSQDGAGTFSPDGQLVAFVSDAGGTWAIWVVRPDGTGLSKLFDLPGPLTAPWEQEKISWGP